MKLKKVSTVHSVIKCKSLDLDISQLYTAFKLKIENNVLF